MISGSPTANVMGVGVFTIPLMKKTGYGPVFAGAVENVASVGGMIMPPVMGASAFIMAEVLGISYTDVCIVAALPAVLYYVALYFAIDFEAAKRTLKGIPKEQLPDKRKILLQGYYIFPVIVLIYSLVIAHESPLKAGIYATLAAFIIGFIGRREERWTLEKLLNAIHSGAKQTIIVTLGCAAVGVTIGSMMQTGLAMKLSSMIIALSGGKVYLVMLLNMVVALLLGTALPAVACYIILAVFGAPSMIEVGIPPMAAHLFILYFGVLSDITPPVGFSAYAAGSLAQANPMKVMVTATRLGLAGFIIPFAFATNYAFLMEGSIFQIVLAGFSGVLAVWVLAAGTIGYLFFRLHWLLRPLFILAAFFLVVDTYIYIKLISYGFVAVMSVVLFFWKLKHRKEGEPIY